MRSVVRGTWTGAREDAARSPVALPRDVCLSLGSVYAELFGVVSKVLWIGYLFAELQFVGLAGALILYPDPLGLGGDGVADCAQCMLVMWRVGAGGVGGEVG